MPPGVSEQLEAYKKAMEAGDEAKAKAIMVTPIWQFAPKPITAPAAPTAGANGRVSLDINLKGNTEAVSSVQSTTEGDVDLNTGFNLAFIG